MATCLLLNSCCYLLEHPGCRGGMAPGPCCARSVCCTRCCCHRSVSWHEWQGSGWANPSPGLETLHRALPEPLPAVVQKEITDGKKCSPFKKGRKRLQFGKWEGFPFGNHLQEKKKKIRKKGIISQRTGENVLDLNVSAGLLAAPVRLQMLPGLCSARALPAAPGTCHAMPPILSHPFWGGLVLYLQSQCPEDGISCGCRGDF